MLQLPSCNKEVKLDFCSMEAIFVNVPFKCFWVERLTFFGMDVLFSISCTAV